MSDWDLSLRHCLPLSWENAAKVLRFVLGEKKGPPLPWRTKTHISSVLLFFSSSSSKARCQRDQTYEDMTSDGTPLQLQLLLLLLLHCTSGYLMCVCVHMCAFFLPVSYVQGESGWLQKNAHAASKNYVCCVKSLLNKWWNICQASLRLHPSHHHQYHLKPGDSHQLQHLKENCRSMCLQ